MLDHLHLWIGRVEDDDALAELFEEQLDDRTKPLNGFAASQGQRRYDHDFFEYRVGKGELLEDLIKLNSYSEFYFDKALTAAKTQMSEEANLFVLADEREFKTPVNVERRGASLKYLGKFPYQK